MTKPSYDIEYAESVADDLMELRAFERRNILDVIEEQLQFEPTRETRHKKILSGLIPPWDHVQPVWQLSIGEYRVFYDVNEEEDMVLVRAIRHKPPHKTTEEIL